MDSATIDGWFEELDPIRPTHHEATAAGTEVVDDDVALISRQPEPIEGSMIEAPPVAPIVGAEPPAPPPAPADELELTPPPEHARARPEPPVAPPREPQVRPDPEPPPQRPVPATPAQPAAETTQPLRPRPAPTHPAVETPEPEPVVVSTRDRAPAARSVIGDRVRAAAAEQAAAGLSTDRDRGPGVDPSLFKSPVRTGQLAKLSLLVLACVALASTALLFVLNGRLGAFADGEPEAFSGVQWIERLVNFGTRPLLLVTLIVAAFFMVRWTSIVYGNVPAFGRRTTRQPRHAAMWSWFVPGVNVVLPKRLIDDAWRAPNRSASGGRDWMLQAPNRWSGPASVLTMLFLVSSAIGWWVGNATVEIAVDANFWSMLGYLFLALACLSATWMIHEVTSRQEIRMIDAMRTKQQAARQS